MKWSYAFHATSKQEARDKVAAESENHPVGAIVTHVIDAMPQDRSMSVSCHGEIQHLTRELEEGETEPPLHGEVVISVRLA